MEIILLEKVDNVGGIGDRVKVKSGYARNYLIPQGKASRRPTTLRSSKRGAPTSR